MALGEIYDRDAVEEAIEERRDFSLRNINDAPVKTTTPGTANQEFKVAHKYGKAPTRFLVLSNNGAGVVYWGDLATDNVHAYLKCSAAGATVEMVFFS